MTKNDMTRRSLVQAAGLFATSMILPGGQTVTAKAGAAIAKGKKPNIVRKTTDIRSMDAEAQLDLFREHRESLASDPYRPLYHCSPPFKMLYDIYHMQIMEGDLIATIRKNIKYIGHFHTAGVPGRHELDENQEIYYPAVMRAIVEAGYTGYVAHEYTPVRDPVESLVQAIRTCDV